MSSFGNVERNGRAFRAPTIRSVLGGLDLVPGEIDTSDGAGNTGSSAACPPRINSYGQFDFSPSMSFLSCTSWLGKEDIDIAPMHGGSPSLGYGSTTFLANTSYQGRIFEPQFDNRQVTDNKEKLLVSSSDLLPFPHAKAETIERGGFDDGLNISSLTNESINLISFSPRSNLFTDYNLKNKSKSSFEMSHFTSLTCQNSRGLNSTHKASNSLDFSNLTLDSSGTNLSDKLPGSIGYSSGLTPILQKISSDPSLNRTVRNSILKNQTPDTFPNKVGFSYIGCSSHAAGEDIDPTWKRRRMLLQPKAEHIPELKQDDDDQHCLKQSHLNQLNINASAQCKKQTVQRRTRSQGRTKRIQIISTDEGATNKEIPKSVDSDCSYDAEMPKGPVKKNRSVALQRTTRPRTSRNYQPRNENGDSRDSDIDPNLWIRVNLGEMCTAAQCTLRNVGTHFATRRHYHATCAHVHTAGVKAGMRFHHHQLEKIRKHQRAHLRKAHAAEGSLCPDVLPHDVQTALIRAGAECHEPRLWSVAMTEKLRGLVELQHQRSGGGKVAWEGVASNMRATKLPGALSLTPAQCMLHWRKIVNKGATVQGVGTWCEAEDRRLSALVQHFKQAWSSVAKFMPGREPKQCRERYNNIVDPSINKNAAWTSEEDALLQQLYIEYGNRFAEVAKRLPGHSYNDVKNRFYVLQRSCRLVDSSGGMIAKRPNTRLNPVSDDTVIALNPSEASLEKPVLEQCSLNYPCTSNYLSTNIDSSNLRYPMKNFAEGQFQTLSANPIGSNNGFFNLQPETTENSFSTNQGSRIQSDMKMSTNQDACISSDLEGPTNRRASWTKDFSDSMRVTAQTGQFTALGVVPEGQEYEYGYFMGNLDENKRSW